MELTKDEAQLALNALLALPVSSNVQDVLTGKLNLNPPVVALVQKLNGFINPQEAPKEAEAPIEDSKEATAEIVQD